MPPAPKGELRTYRRADGSTSFTLRFRARGQRWNIRLGSEREGWTEPRARKELARQLALVAAGVWTPPTLVREADEAVQTFHAVASLWLENKELELKPTSVADLRWRLECHLLPFFAAHLPSQIHDATVADYKLHKQRERKHLEQAIAAGKQPRDARNQRIRPLSNESINKTLRTLGEVLDFSNGRNGQPERNPVRRRGVMLKVPKPSRSYLEADDLVELFDVAGQLDGPRPASTERAQTARRLRDEEGHTWRSVAAELGVSVSTAIYFYRQPAPRQIPRPRRAILATLGCSGLRAQELCDLDWQDLDLGRGVIRVCDSKTPAGVRSVYITPWLRDELTTYRAALNAVEPRSPAFPTRSGARRTRHNLLQRVVHPAIGRANEIREAEGRALLSKITNHTFRRTYISLLFAAGAEPPYVMSQVGHEDAKTTLNIYAQVLRRRDRTKVSSAFDKLVADAVPSVPTASIPSEVADFDAGIGSGKRRRNRPATR